MLEGVDVIKRSCVCSPYFGWVFAVDVTRQVEAQDVSIRWTHSNVGRVERMFSHQSPRGRGEGGFLTQVC